MARRALWGSGPTTFCTSMRFSVRVPVLSVAITVTLPKASTAARRRTTALRRAMRSTPRAKARVSTAGSPSGTAATARATAKRRTWAEKPSARKPSATRAAASPITQRATLWPKPSRRRSRGVFSSRIPAKSPAMRPMALLRPVRLTSIRALPRTNRVPEKTSSPTLFSTGTLSPVRRLSSTKTPLASRSTPSAGMRSPASRRTTSPGTISRLGRCWKRPSRRTQAMGSARALRRLRASSERFSCRVPRVALRIRMARMAKASRGSPWAPS
ncbi:hypothetical protein HRbin38_00457 [bacterium HR38]|nr:hypothetical protein HRbin38_00457 [bacterium HR38]